MTPGPERDPMFGTYKSTDLPMQGSVNGAFRLDDLRQEIVGSTDTRVQKCASGVMNHSQQDPKNGATERTTNGMMKGVQGATEEPLQNSTNGRGGATDRAGNGTGGSGDQLGRTVVPIGPLEPEGRSASGGKWPVLRNVVVLSIAFMVHFTAFQGAGNLQSSINSSAGLGTASLATIYGALILSNTFLPVLVIRWLGCKWAVAVSFIAYMPYIAAQFSPSFYTLIPAALFVGLGGGPLWCGKCTYLSVVAEAYSKMADVPTDTLTIRFFGIFFMLFQCSQVWGNLVSSLVFSTGVAADVVEDVGDLCGANFCPSASTNSNNTNLSRPSDEKIYTVAGIYLGCMALAVCIVALGVDSLKRYNEDTRQGSGTGLSGLQLMAVTLKLLKEPWQLLLIPMVMWLGMEQAFIGADYTASYVSCAWGVRNIGFVMICYGVVNSASAMLMGSLVKLTGRVPIVTGAALLNLGLIAALLLWTPSVHATPVFFVLAGLWGAADGVWLVQINAMCGFLFPGREEAAYSNFRLWESLGFIIAYSYSSVLCTDVKLYILLVLLLVGLVGYYVIEWQLRRQAAQPKTGKD